MKTLKLFLSAILIVSLLTSCEKEEEVTNPFIGTWENTETTVAGSVVATLTFRADMTQTVVFVVDNNSAISTISNDYNYSYTDTELTVSQPGGNPEITEYTISGNSLTLLPGTNDETTYTKI